MKKAYSICILAVLPLANSVLGHSSQLVHMHPHGENTFLTTWMVPAAIGLALGGRFLLKRVRQK